MVFADIHRRCRPLPQQRISGGRSRARRGLGHQRSLGLLHRQRPQRLADLIGKTAHIQILTDRPALGALELKQLGWRRGDAAGHHHLSHRGGQRGQAGAVSEISRHPAALYQHRIAIGQQQGRDHKIAWACVHLPVVQVHRGIRQPAPAQHDAAVVLVIGLAEVARQVGLRQRRQLGTRLHAGLQFEFLARPIELPEAQPRRQQRGQQRRQQQPSAAQPSPPGQRCHAHRR